MPIREFRCPQGHVTEVIEVSVKARLTALDCPVCGERSERIISTVNWQQGTGPKESPISRAIGRVRKAERDGKL